MSLYFVMRPSDANDPCPVFTRYGRMAGDLKRAQATARKVNGRVYATDGAGNTLVADYWTAPAPKPEHRPFKVHQRVMAEAALFGRLVGN